MPPNPQFTPEQIKTMEALIAERVEKALAARPTGNGTPTQGVSREVSREERKSLFKRALGYGIKAQLLRNAPPGTIPDALLKSMDEAAAKHLVAFQEAQKTILTSTIFAQGGSLKPEYWSDEIIEVLRDFTVVLQSGARQQSLQGKFNIGKLDSMAVADFVDEGEEPTIPTPATSSVILDPKKLMGLFRATRDMVMDPTINGTETLANDMLGALGTAADKNAMVGDGTGARPTGIYKQVHTSNKNDQTAAFTQANATSIIADLDNAERLVKASKIPLQGNNPGWVMTTQAESRLKTLRDGAGWIFRNEMNSGTLNGYPYKVTDSISGLGKANKDFILFGLWAQLYYGQKGGLEVSMSDQQEFSKDNILVRGVGYLDFKLRHTKAFSIIDAIVYA